MLVTMEISTHSDKSFVNTGIGYVLTWFFWSQVYPELCYFSAPLSLSLMVFYHQILEWPQDFKSNVSVHSCLELGF